MQAGGLERGAGVVAERQQHLLVVLVEPTGEVRGHHDPVELVAHVDRDRDQVVYLAVGVGRRLDGLREAVGSQHRVALHGLGEEVAHDRALGGVGLEALDRGQPRGGLVVSAVPIARGDQESLLGLEQADGERQHQRRDVLEASERAALAVQAVDVTAKLPDPVALRTRAAHRGPRW